MRIKLEVDITLDDVPGSALHTPEDARAVVQYLLERNLSENTKPVVNSYL